MSGPSAAKRPRLDARSAAVSTPTRPLYPVPPPVPSSVTAASTSAGSTLAPRPYIPLATPSSSSSNHPPNWSTPSTNPIPLDPALQSNQAFNPNSNTGSPTPFNRYIPQQQQPPGISTSTAPTTSVPQYARPYTPGLSSTPGPGGTPATPNYAHYPYTSTATSTVTPIGFLRTNPPSSTTYTPYHQTSAHPNPATSSTQYYSPAAAHGYQSVASSSPYSAIPTNQNVVMPGQPALDTSDPNDLKDVLASSGIDTKAEAEASNRSYDFYQSQQASGSRSDRSKKQAFIDSSTIASTMRTIAATHNVKSISDESISYAALALRQRLLGIIKASIRARDHRLGTTVQRPPSMYNDFMTPMWDIVVRKDVGKQLAVLSNVERAEELRIRRERQEKKEGLNTNTMDGSTSSPGADGGSASVDGGGDGSKKRKRVKELGPGQTAKSLPEDVRNKLINDAASRAVGGSRKYAWMAAGPASSSSAVAPTASRPPITTNGSAGSSMSTIPRPALPNPSGGWSRAAALTQHYEPVDERRTLTLRDVEFAIDREKGHGGGRGSARGWS